MWKPASTRPASEGPRAIAGERQGTVGGEAAAPEPETRPQSSGTNYEQGRNPPSRSAGLHVSPGDHTTAQPTAQAEGGTGTKQRLQH